MVHQAFARAWALYTKHFGEWLKMTFVETLLRLIAAAPLLLLTTSYGTIGMIAAGILFVLLVLPARSHAAEAYAEAIHGGSPFSGNLLFGSRYGSKMLAGIVNALKLLLWALPLLVLTGFIVYYSDHVDAFTVMRNVKALTGDLMTSLYLIAAVWLLTFVPLLIGIALHSADRHAIAQTGSKEILRKQKGKVLCAWLAALITIVPFLIVAGVLASNYLTALFGAIKTMTQTMKMEMPSFDSRAWGIGAAYLVLRLPLMPFKALISAELVDGLGSDVK